MAKKKKSYASKRRSKRSSGSHSRRRRRVGAVALNANSMILKVGAAAAGYFVGDKVTAPIDKMIGDKVDAKIVGAGKAGLGYLLAQKKGKKTAITTGAGWFLVGAGVKQLMHSMGIGGIGPYGRVPVIAGPYGRVPVIAGGYSPNRSLNGYTPNASLNSRTKVMAGVNTNGGSGSGITRDPGSDYMN